MLGIWIACLAATTGAAQNLLTNPSLDWPEYTPAFNSPPPYWSSCAGTPDVLPNTYGAYNDWGRKIAPSDGTSYVGLLSIPLNNPDESESFGQDVPFVAGQGYYLKLDIAYQPDYQPYLRPHMPGRIKIWLGTNRCEKTQLAWTSPIISNTSWQTYTASFTPTANYTYFRVEAVHESEETGMLLDNMYLSRCPMPTIAPSAALTARNNRWPVDTTINLNTAYTSNVPPTLIRWKIKYANRPGAEVITTPTAYEFEQTGLVTLTPTSYCTGKPVPLAPMQLTVTGGFDQQIQVRWPMIWEDTWPELSDDRPVLCEVKILKTNGRLLYAGETDGYGKLLVKGLRTGDRLQIEQVAFPVQALAEVTITQSATAASPLVINLSPIFK
jgi:hypothetical protein